MIDPNIALSYRSPEIQDPLTVQTRQANLKSIANQQQLQQAQLTGMNQENAARDVQMRTAAALNQALAENTSTSPDGSIQVNHAGVVNALNQGGFGAAAQQYQDAQAKRDEALTKLSGDKLALAGQQHDLMIQGLGNVLGVTDPAQRTALWSQEVKRAQAAGIPEAQSLNPAAVPDDPTLQSMLITSKEGRQMIQTRLAQQQADTAAQREKDNAKRVDAYYEWMMRRGDVNRYRFTNQYDKDNHPIILDTQDGSVLVDKTVTGAPWATTGAGGGRQLTPDASLANQRANKADYEKNAAAELTARQQRDGLDAALQSGKAYLDKNGRLTPFSSMKDADGNPISADTIAAYQAEMRQRRAVLETAIEQAVANKNNAMQANGVTPQVSTQQAIAGYRGQAQKPAAAQNAPASGKTFAADPTGRSQFKQGQIVYDKRGNPVKIAGFTADGKVIPGK